MNTGGSVPGFFYGNYGGPRVMSSSSQANFGPRYVFSKSKSENVDLSSLTEDSSSVQKSFAEPLNDDILEGSANLFDQAGKRVLVMLRDGRTLVGELASVDVFSNLLLQDAVERIVVGKQFGDIIRGIFIIRGDNLMLIAEVDGEKEAEMERVLEQVPVDEILVAQKFEQDCQNAKHLKYADALKQRGVAFPRPLEDEF